MRPDEIARMEKGVAAARAMAGCDTESPRQPNAKELILSRARLLRDAAHRMEQLADALPWNLSDVNQQTLRTIVDSAFKINIPC